MAPDNLSLETFSNVHSVSCLVAEDEHKQPMTRLAGEDTDQYGYGYPHIHQPQLAQNTVSPMNGVAVGTIKSGTLFYRGQTDVSLKQMNGVAWRLSRATSNESAPPAHEGDPDLYCTGFDLLGGEGYKYVECAAVLLCHAKMEAGMP